MTSLRLYTINVTVCNVRNLTKQVFLILVYHILFAILLNLNYLIEANLNTFAISLTNYCSSFAIKGLNLFTLRN